MEACIYREKGIERKVNENFHEFFSARVETRGGGDDGGGAFATIRENTTSWCGGRRWNSRRI